MRFYLFCRFSHGEAVRYVDLKEYNKPNFSLLNQMKHPVLAKQSDNIWYKGRVVSSDFNEKTCQIKLEHSKKDVKCDFHDILPIEEGKQVQHLYFVLCSYMRYIVIHCIV